jgi:hypothetical protein
MGSEFGKGKGVSKMNRRTFLKLTGATAVLATTPLTFAEKKETQQWIRLADNPPKKGQKVVMCCLGSGRTTVWYGTIEETGVWGDVDVAYSMLKFKKRVSYQGNKLVKKCSAVPISLLCFFGNKTSYRYWLPVEGEFPKTLPPFPSRASKWIAFKDQMPSSSYSEEIEVRDQEARTARGWCVKSDRNEFFVPCGKDKEWLNLNMIEINKLMWSWRYV